jgi:hypothetical protein
VRVSRCSRPQPVAHHAGAAVTTSAVPFAVSFLFVDRTGQFLIPQPLFKSIMVVVFGGLGTALIAAAFRHVEPTARSGLALGSIGCSSTSFSTLWCWCRWPTVLAGTDHQHGHRCGHRSSQANSTAERIMKQLLQVLTGGDRRSKGVV